MARFDRVDKVIRRPSQETRATIETAQNIVERAANGDIVLIKAIENIILAYVELIKIKRIFDDASAAWIMQPILDAQEGIERLRILIQSAKGDSSICTTLESIAAKQKKSQKHEQQVAVSGVDTTAAEMLKKEEIGIPERIERQLQEKLQQLILEGYPIHRLADLLDAADCVEAIANRTSGMSFRFNVRTWIEKAAKRPEILLPENARVFQGVIMPPDSSEISWGDGDGGEMEMGEIPRTRYLLELLAELQQRCHTIEGTNAPNMARKKSYVAFVLSDIRKLVLVNNESGNGTYIVHNLQGAGDEEVLQWLRRTKLELRSERKDGTVSFVPWPGTSQEWKTIMRSLLLAEQGEVIEQDTGVKESRSPLERKTAPEGWMIPVNFARSIGRDVSAVLRLANPYRAAHPEWFGRYANGRWDESEYFHPQLLSAIKFEIDSYVAAPEGWRTLMNLVKDCDVDRESIKLFVAKFRMQHPDWFKQFRISNGRVLEHFHPDLVKKILDKYKNIPEEAPQGWQTNFNLARKLRRAEVTVAEFADRFRISQPEWFREYSKSGRPREHYAPELVQLIVRDLKNSETKE